ncbi:MAG: RNA-binding protein [Clostridia bacterium]|nr:RNA-binding protein [Clostridia bacterium]MDR3644605.1 RNA-binding protein [Clostridia bacterium]
MEIGLNAVVLSLKGRDSGKLFVVVGLEADVNYVRIADGRLRSLQKPKKKKLKHLKAVGRMDEAFTTDRGLHKALHAFAVRGESEPEGGYQLVEGRCN